MNFETYKEVEEAVKMELELIAQKEILPEDNFMSIGIDSLMATKFVANLARNHNIEITLRDFFTHSSIIKISSFIVDNDKTESSIEGEI